MPPSKHLTGLASSRRLVCAPGLQVVLKEDGSLYRVFPGGPEEKLLPYKGLQFHVKEFSDQVWEFVVEKGQVKALKQGNPSGEYVFARK